MYKDRQALVKIDATTQFKFSVQYQTTWFPFSTTSLRLL